MDRVSYENTSSRPSVTAEDVSKWGVFITFLSTPWEHRRRGGRKSWRLQRSVVSGHGMAIALQLTVVVTYVRPVEDQASSNSSVDGEELMKPHP